MIILVGKNLPNVFHSTIFQGKSFMASVGTAYVGATQN
jgi:hypothetical protein